MTDMIVIIGAGIAGLSLGWELASAGADVTILEKNTIASGASGAAGAYLEPRPGMGKLRALEWASLKLWPDFAERLEQQSGMDIGFCQQGVTHIGYLDWREKLERAVEFHRSSGWDVEWLEGDELKGFEPALSSKVAAGFHLPQVHHIDARKTCHALAIAFQRKGGTLIEGAEVVRLEEKDSGQEVLTATGENYMANTLIISAGFGSNDISNLPDDIPISRPVRGILVEIAQPDKKQLLRHPVKRPDGVLLPMSNGNLLVGSSHEEGETLLSAPKSIVNKMLKSATRTVPAITELPIVETRIGIRALVGDGLLRLGRSKDNSDIFYSLSHAGAGFLRAPLIASEFAGIIINPDERPKYIAPYFKSN